MEQENAVLNEETVGAEVSFDELETKLQNELGASLSELEFLDSEKAKIGNPEELGEAVKGIVWEQFINQMANQMADTVGEDFIEANRGLTLDLRTKAHIQTPENFANGNIATHNYISKEQLEQNYDRYKNTPHKEFRKKYVNPGMNATLKRAGELKKEGVDTVTDIYTGRQIPTDTKLENGKNNPKAAQREHVRSSEKLYKNSSLQMANTNKELADTINNPENLQGYTTAERNNRKDANSSDKMEKRDKNKHWEKADKRAEKYIKQREKEGEDRLKKEGRKTQKEEAFRAFRMSRKALRAAIMQLLAELIKEVISKLVKWFKSAKRKLETFLESLKEAIHSFVSKIKTHILAATETIATAIATAIIGPVVRTVKKVWALLKQGVASVKEAINYLKDPKNRQEPFSERMLEVGKIIMSGITVAGTLFLSDVIEKGLMIIPGFAFEIPLFGSLASIIGLFMGGLISGIVGALVINLINQLSAKQQKADLTREQIHKENEILQKQSEIMQVSMQELYTNADTAFSAMSERHKQAARRMKESMDKISKYDKAEDDARLDRI